MSESYGYRRESRDAMNPVHLHLMLNHLPVVGMGFRISTEVGRLGLDMVWATIAVAALAGSALYGLIALIERGVTFWHPSQRH